VYPTDEEARDLQEDEAIGAEVFTEVQGNKNCRCTDPYSALVQLCTSIGKTKLGDLGRVKLL
jgi:hypothetical protein